MYQLNNSEPKLEYNKTSRKLLIIAIGLMALCYFFPVIVLPNYTINGSSNLSIFDLLNSFGLILVLASIASMYQGYRVAKSGRSNKMWVWASFFLVLLPIYAINTITNRINSSNGATIAFDSIGFYSMILSIILAIIAGFKSSNFQINPNIQNIQYQSENEYISQSQNNENSSIPEYEDEVPSKNMDNPILNNNSVSIYCSNCGKLNQNAKFCENCGMKL